MGTLQRPRTIRVLIVDDHDLVRVGLTHVVNDQPDMEVAGEASSAAEALELLKSTPLDLALIDINLPDSSGITLLKQVKDSWPALPVLILTAASESHYAMSAVKSGASGYLSKDHAVEHLVPAIRKAIAGGKYITPRVAEQLAQHLDDHQHGVGAELSLREVEVLRQIAQGRSTSQIADNLNLSAKTVGTYRERIQHKTGLRTTAELTRFALSRNYLS